MRYIKLFILLALFMVPTWSLTTNWVKVQDEGLMGYIDFEPFKQLDDSTIFKITLNPEFKDRYETYFLGITTRVTFEDWITTTAPSINIPAYITTGDRIAVKNYVLGDILERGYIKVEHPNTRIEYKFHIGWQSEEWQLISNTTLIIGVCDSGGYSEFYNCTPSLNWTSYIKDIYVNSTANETYWLLNGTTPEYSEFQIWTDIHSDSYDIEMSLTPVVALTNELNLGVLVSELIQNHENLAEVTFESDGVGDNPTEFGITQEGGNDGVIEVNNTVVKLGDRSLWFKDISGAGYPQAFFNFTSNSNNLIEEFDIYTDALASGQILHLSYVGSSASGNIAQTYGIESNTSISVYPSGDLTYTNCTGNTGEWVHHKVLYDFSTDKTKLWVNNEYCGDHVFRELGGEVDSMASVDFLGSTPAIGNFYLDNYILYEEDALPENKTYLIKWSTGWAYCESHDNCTSDYFCSLSETINSKCESDYVSTMDILGTGDTYAEGDITFFLNYEYEDDVLTDATVWGELYNASVNGTLLQNITANFSTRYYVTFNNMTEFEGYYIKVYGIKQPFYALSEDNKEFDVVIATINITFPQSTEKVYAREIFPRFVLTISDFTNVGTCFYKTPQQQSDTFTVSNNVTFNSVPINPINSWNKLTVECDIGGLTIREFVDFDSLVVPDNYLLGINLNSHIASQTMLYKIKETLWIIGFPFFLFILIVSIITFVSHHLFKKGVLDMI